jgi:hypothetical protein
MIIKMKDFYHHTIHKNMQLPEHIVDIIKEFLLVPHEVFEIKRDFYNQLQLINNVWVLSNMMDDLGRFRDPYETRHERLNSVMNETRRRGIPIIRVFRSLIFKECDNNVARYLQLGTTYFKKCLPNNRFNWTTKFKIGDIAKVIEDLSTTNSHYTPVLLKKCIVTNVYSSSLTVGLYDYVIEEGDDFLPGVQYLDTISTYREIHFEHQCILLKEYV